MDHFRICQALDRAPPSTLLGLTVRDERLRALSRERLALWITDHLDDQLSPDHRQLGLPL